MLFDEAFSSMENLIKYLKMYDIAHICAETTLYSNSEDLIATTNKATELLSPQNNTILLKHSIQDVHDAAEHYWNLYNCLNDSESKDTLLHLLKYRLTLNNVSLIDAYSIQTPYFDSEILSLPPDCIYIDYSTDADIHIPDFINTFTKYKKIYIFTGSNQYDQKCKKTFSETDNLSIISYQLGEKKINVKLPNPIIPGSVTEIHIEPLDSAIQEPISFLRINSAGQEQAVLKGAKNHIANDKPAIAVCGGNMIYNLWQIPELIKQINPNYTFYLRHYDVSSVNGTIIYAIIK